MDKINISNENIVLLAILLLLSVLTNCVSASKSFLKTDEIRVRDPFIYADQKNKIYYLYAQSANRANSDFIGVEAYSSKDMKNWTQPQPVLTLPKDINIHAVWAPEMHEYKGKYYLFVTLTYNKKLSDEKTVDNNSWPALTVRGTHVFHADSPLGPFKSFKKTSHTPENWMALDGTLYVEADKPYMIFCHEWIQTIDGSIDYVQLKDNLSDTIDEPNTLFKASDAPGQNKHPEKGKVTDGCFLYKSPQTNRLFMIWSTFIPGNEYCILLTHSETGKINGPWKEQKVIFTKNGGHGMIFKSFDGRLILSFHQPNSGPDERLRLFEIIDKGETLEIGLPYHN